MTMPNPNHTLSSFNAYIAKGEGNRQTNGAPGGGKTFDWTARVAERSRARRTPRTPA
jgi:hypothetical protein